MILNGFNLPETRQSRFGEELNAEKMKNAIWLRPESVAQIEFLEWTDASTMSTFVLGGTRTLSNPWAEIWKSKKLTSVQRRHSISHAG